jgi:hypothetical protein
MIDEVTLVHCDLGYSSDNLAVSTSPIAGIKSYRRGLANDTVLHPISFVFPIPVFHCFVLKLQIESTIVS